MKITAELKQAIETNILCWLATSSNVNNIQENKNVCISFIDILVQKGFQVKGFASIIDKTDATFFEMNQELQKMTAGKFPFRTITKIKIESIKQIIAPKYILYPETTEKAQIESAKKVYGV